MSNFAQRIQRETMRLDALRKAMTRPDTHNRATIEEFNEIMRDIQERLNVIALDVREGNGEAN